MSFFFNFCISTQMINSWKSPICFNIDNFLKLVCDTFDQESFQLFRNWRRRVAQSVIFHIIHVFEGFSANVASEKCLIFIFFVASFVDEQIVLLVKGSIAMFTIVSLHRSLTFFTTQCGCGQKSGFGCCYGWIYGKHFDSADYVV